MNSFQKDAARLGMTLSDEQLAAFQDYCDLLVAWNARFNLTAISDRDQILVKHFLDSLSCALAVPEVDEPLRLLDVGAGAGFPGLPLKIAFPQLTLTLLEATGKKVEFLRAVVDELGLTGVSVLNARAEDAGQDPDQRTAYDLVAARAVAPLATLAELTLPFARIGGTVIAPKGPEAAAEVEAAQAAIRTLGGELRQLLPVQVPGLEAARHLVLLDKIESTPDRYPRRPGIPAKRPLT